MTLEPLADKWAAFGWNVISCDGNSVEEFLHAAELASNFRSKPSVIIARTFMGKGVSFMEDDYHWHGVPPSVEQGKQALAELPQTQFGDFVEFEWEKGVAVPLK